MPRKPREEEAGGIHHVTARAPSRRLLFLTEADRRLYLRLLADEVRTRRWVLFTYCQMTNHLHLLLQTPEPDLGAGMKSIHETFATQINRGRDENGVLIGSRFANTLVRSESHFAACVRYIARNPVEAGMCRDAADWQWSAHPALSGTVLPPPWLAVESTLGFLGTDPKGYVDLVGRSHEQVLADLQRAATDDTWMLAARQDFGISVEVLARFVGLRPSTVYEKLARARKPRTP